jgi:hypothetical protein
MKWFPIHLKYNKIQSYQSEMGDMMIHIIKSGFEDEWLVVYEDAYKLTYGNVDILTADDIFKKFEIVI